jgi:EAL domain-containing protein (putative c-di-GMP-specific phosphodiesterase class I)/CHASE2 domain-containing sensor protein
VRAKGTDVPANQPNASDSRRQRLKLLLWPLVFALLFGLTGFGELVENALRIMRNEVREQPVSGQIVLVQVDDKSLREIDNWPWPRARQAKVIDEINRLGAKRLVVDILYTGPSERAGDQALAASLSRWRDVTLAAQTRIGDLDGKLDKGFPIPLFASRAKIGSIAFPFDWQGAVWKLPLSMELEGKRMPSLSSVIAERPATRTNDFRVDYSLDIDTIPTISATDMLAGKVDRSAIAGKTVVFGTNAMRVGDQWMIPGKGKRGGVFIHVLGAETLKKGTPRDIGWIPGLLVALVAAAAAVRSDRTRVLGLAAIGFLVFPIGLEMIQVYADITPALFLIGVIAARLLWQKVKGRELINTLTGLPNLAALAADKKGRDLPLVAVRVHNYAEIASTLDAAGERTFVEQLVSRLTLGTRERCIFQGDEGIFAWFADKGTPFSNHLEALHSLFRSPVRANGINYDVALSFGVEIGSSRSVSSRLGSALVAADEADAESLKWKFHDPSRLQEVPWRLSLLSQLDTAIEQGQVWLAYQPKVDLKTGRTVGAEALARWTHPDKGPISPTEFVTAAEQSDRIGKLTDFVLEQAVAAGAELSRKGFDFGIAVNLSARMLNDRNLPERVAALLGRHGLRADKLTLELTETAAVSGSGNGVDLLARMRDLGVRIAIDDYGTGLSTLDYLKKMPASEIKIDQSFIKTMRDNRSDLIMVQSTIALAHSLGRTVVAEGVEDPHSLEQLRQMECDIAQGFITGRPMGFEELVRRLNTERKRSAA